MKLQQIDIVSLGCSKNLVDSERLLKLLSDAGFTPRHNPEGRPSKIVIINTCGFIGDAKEESIDTILSYIPAKEKGIVEKIIVMGCLSQRYADELKAEIPEVDLWTGKFDWISIVSYLRDNYVANAKSYDRILTTCPHHAFLKIAEGCNRFCAFCAIPLITGRYKSRPIEEIVAEVKLLVDKGVKEFNIIAQDLSSYGLDLYGEKSLARLISAISEVDGVEWIRLHYAYPADFPYDILPVIRDNPKVCKYLDIALQHISDKVLDNMHRHIDSKQTLELIERIRREVPDIHLRTTLMVGFPGEGEAEFQELLEFTRKARFERMGAFAYCEEDDTTAARLFSDSIPQEVKQSRLDSLMRLQEEISMEIQQEKVGSTIRAIIDREDVDYFVGRSQFDSPEVDPEILIKKTKKLKIGEFYDIQITEALPFELIGEVKA